MQRSAEPFREVIQRHLDALYPSLKSNHPEISCAKVICTLGDGPHKNGLYDPTGDITLSFQRNKNIGIMHLKDVDINSSFSFLIC